VPWESEAPSEPQNPCPGSAPIHPSRTQSTTQRSLALPKNRDPTVIPLEPVQSLPSDSAPSMVFIIGP
jgi:hypothetical protein